MSRAAIAAVIVIALLAGAGAYAIASSATGSEQPVTRATAQPVVHTLSDAPGVPSLKASRGRSAGRTSGSSGTTASGERTGQATGTSTGTTGGTPSVGGTQKKQQDQGPPQDEGDAIRE